MFGQELYGKQRLIFNQATFGYVWVAIPKSTSLIVAYLRGAGGGGSGGNTAAVGAVARGGGAGGGGSRARLVAPASVFGDSLLLCVPRGGLGGAAGVAGSDATAEGVVASAAYCGIFIPNSVRRLAALASSGQGGGLASISSSSITPVLNPTFISDFSIGTQGQPGDPNGANATAYAAVFTNGTTHPGTPGGGISTAEVIGNSGTMVGSETGTEFPSFNGVGANTDGPNGIWIENYLCGFGGVGGGAALTGTAGRGGNGGTGCGGGGGGAARTGATAGAGGNGGDGRIDLWFI